MTDDQAEPKIKKRTQSFAMTFLLPLQREANRAETSVGVPGHLIGQTPTSSYGVLSDNCCFRDKDSGLLTLNNRGYILYKDDDCARFGIAVRYVSSLLIESVFG